MNHRWVCIVDSPVKGEFGRRKCSNCSMEVRRIRRGEVTAHRGRIEEQYRMGPRGKWYSVRGTLAGKIPICKACRTCPTCGGTGVITREEMRRLKRDEE